MEMVSGWQVFSKEEMNNDNAIKVFSDMIQNFDHDIPKWKEDCGMRKLLECQREACYKAIAALNAVVEQTLNSSSMLYVSDTDYSVSLLFMLEIRL